MARKRISEEQLKNALRVSGLDKIWLEKGELRHLWRTETARGFPRPYFFRAKLAIDGNIVEGAFVDCYFKKSRFLDERDKISMTLCIDSLRAISLDDGPPTSHTNIVGRGLPFYGKTISHPHMHRLAAEGEGYAEPLEDDSPEALWQLFLAAAKIHLAPLFSLPPGQLDLAL